MPRPTEKGLIKQIWGSLIQLEPHLKTQIRILIPEKSGEFESRFKLLDVEDNSDFV